MNGGAAASASGGWTVLLVWLAVINLLTFIVYGADKRRARKGKWRVPEKTLFLLPEQVRVLHTLVVAPAVKGRGCGTAFVRFYEELARTTGRPYLRIDTNARNTPARALYARLGYTEAGIVAGTFNGIPGVELVCLEKKV